MRWSFPLILAVLAVLAMAIEIVEAANTSSSSSKKTTSKKTTTKASTTTKKTTKTSTTTTLKSKKTTTTTTTTSSSRKDDKKDIVNPGVYTSWVTVYETVNNCGPFTTTVTPCDICTSCVITAYDQCITSTTTSTWPTSTYCPTPGWYDECSCQISQPQWIWYDVPCEVEYSCPYQDWYFMNEKDVDCVVKVNGEICDEKKEKWTVTLSKTITKTVTDYPKSKKSTGRPASKKSSQRGSLMPTSRHLPSLSSQPRSYTIKPTQRPASSGAPLPPASSYPRPPPYSSSAPAPAPAPPSAGPAPALAPSPPPAGSPLTTFKLTTTIDGSDAVIMQQSGLLVLTPAINSASNVAFTLTSTGELMTSSGEYVYLTITDGVGGDFQYGTFSDKRKRAVEDRMYYGAFSLSGGLFSMVINGTAMAIQRCGEGNVLSGSFGTMSGCNAVTMESAPVESANTTSSSTSAAGSATSSASGTGSASATGSVSATDSNTGSAASATGSATSATGSATCTTGSSGSTDSSPSAAGSSSGSLDSSASATGSSTPSISASSPGSVPSASASGSGSVPSSSPSTTDTDGGSSTTGSSSGSITTSPSGTETTNPSGSATDSSSSSAPTTTDGPTFGNGTNATMEERRARMARAMKFRYI